MKAQTREQEIARGLKGLAQDLNVPVLALSELEITQGRPGLADLRESGSLDREADVVMFIYRPAMDEAIAYSEDSNLEGVAEIIIARQHIRPLGSVHLMWDAARATFESLAPEYRIEREE